MQRHGEEFARKNIEQLDGTLLPLRQKILQFQHTAAAHTESEKERALLANRSGRSARTSAGCRERRRSDAGAGGKSQTQGAWGEMILQTILEKSGLREGEEYVTQQSHINEEGERQRPDVIVKLPNEQSIVIDAKVSLTATPPPVAAETPRRNGRPVARARRLGAPACEVAGRQGISQEPRARSTTW